ncbi:monovalent cation:proton antiporter-2 (CPA2) family protein [Notoacmeibacter sp. MSK16QG-6]|uniref:monovalent cation:proton antiporter-2 (CPA2) family protein n=1 Tax=Notoacmeibacter sp. MSK16QG-6 TaxID=2957982 RepID=UPI00209EB8F1|nr:monovalent cation:proton antiporter-2 (CPA2) family protein [Notoacmeibacter sp. MSK16QG-6]MCP1198501.1 monovalent cation:proton antiporter-2 (CPA2) family protein [Notoacmeibacter sp. MSK16QG-6]
MATPEVSLYGEAVLLLAGAVIAAPLFKRIGLGTVLGYIAAGILIGPVARLIADGEEILHIAELGVVFLLFLIGLELKPSRLWALRRDIFGLGLSQVLLTGFILSFLLLTFLPPAAAIIAGFGLALSSTAFGMQILEDTGDTNRRYGQRAFSILLFQDIAIAPLLVLATFLAPFAPEDVRSPLLSIIIAIGTVAGLVLAGRYLLNPLFRFIGNTGAREVMIAAALLLVIGAGLAMQWAGLSMAMGAFIAGVLLAESRYRHELEADIEPFRGILLGLFFMAVGLSLDLTVIQNNLLLIVAAVPALLLIKGLVIFVLAKVFGSTNDDAMRVATLLPQGGEFGFVLFSAAASSGIFSARIASILVAIVTISMALTPLSRRIGDWITNTTLQDDDVMEEDFANAGSDVLMIGFSRFGQITAQMLLAGGVDVTVIDLSAERVTQAGKFGFRIYYGDGCRKDVLEAAGIRRAKIVLVCTHLPSITNRIVDLVSSEYPNAKIYARSWDRAHAIALRKRNVDYELRETVESALVFGRHTLHALGIEDHLAHEIEKDVRQRDEERLAIQQVEGLFAGQEKVFTSPVPEPLIEPKKRREAASAKNKDDGAWSAG